MSSAVAFRATCGACTREFDTEVWRSLHIRRMPAARAELLAGQFSVHVCPWCGASCRIEPVVLYTDFDRFEWFALYPAWAIARASSLALQVEAGFRTNMREFAAPMMREIADRFLVRTCFGVPALREKVLAREIGLDDRALELVKLGVLRTLVKPLGPDVAMWLQRLDGERLLFTVVRPPGPDGTAVCDEWSVPIAHYHRALATPGDWFVGSLVDWRLLLMPATP